VLQLQIPAGLIPKIQEVSPLLGMSIAKTQTAKEINSMTTTLQNGPDR